MKFAVIYSGYIGNIKRSFNSLKAHLFLSDDDIDVYIITKNLSKNITKFMNKTSFKDIVYKEVKSYNIEELKACIGYPIVSITEWEKIPALVEEYNIEVKKFLDRTRNYEYKIPRVLNYDKENKVFPTPSIGSIFEQYFMVHIGIQEIKKLNKQYDLILRFRDRVTLSSKIPREIIDKEKIFLLGWRPELHICEAFVICTRDRMVTLFENYHKMIGGYRSEKLADPKFADVDNTFSGESQFALRLYSKFDEKELFFSKYVIKHEVVSYKDLGFGSSLNSSAKLPEYMDECEWKIYETI